jgi:long-chain acyl-CoA synthetase
VWELFDATATRVGDRIAVEVHRRDGLERHSYTDIRRLALARAQWLIDRGVQSGDRCAILADPDGAWCASYLAILRVGAIAIPLDARSPAAQLATIVADADLGVLLVDRQHAEFASGLKGGGALLIHDLHDDFVNVPLRTLSPLVSDEQPAVVLYTSGTTGNPKGVVLTHGNLASAVKAASARIVLTAEDSMLAALPLSHAFAHVVSLLLPFAAGARVVFLETVNPFEALQALSARHITVFVGPPHFLTWLHQHLLHEMQRANFVRRVLFRPLLALNSLLRYARINIGWLLFPGAHHLVGRRVRLFVIGGSSVSAATRRRLWALGFTVVQSYASTETSGVATLSAPRDGYDDTAGRVLPEQELKIVPTAPDDRDGEIAIRGPVVMQGYFNRPDATAAAIRDGWLFTGDVGRLDRRGRLVITGRKTDAIALPSGKSIYREEIEAHYAQSPFVKELCVMARAQGGGNGADGLFAVVVPDLELMRAKRMVNAGDILRFEMEGQSVYLPPHKRVSDYDVWLEPLPRTTTGTLKRHEIGQRVAYKQQQGARPADREIAGEQDDHTNAAIAVIRTRAKTAVRLDSNLELDLGFDSMERVELLTELEQRFNVPVDPTHAHHIFTVEQLIEAVRPASHSTLMGVAEDAWARLLRDLPPATDPVLSGLLERRRISTPIFYFLSRVLRLGLARTQVQGLEHLPRQGPYIISPNHQGYLDPFFVCGVLPYRIFKQLFFVGAAEYFETSLMSWVARECNCVPVDPDANLVSAMKASAFGLAHGKILMLFPEGERSIDGTVKRFKKGSPILSRYMQVPIVPVAINGAFEIWPRNRSFTWTALLPWSTHRVQVSFGRPVQFDGSTPHAEAAAALRQKVVELWEPLA